MELMGARPMVLLKVIYGQYHLEAKTSGGQGEFKHHAL